MKPVRKPSGQPSGRPLPHDPYRPIAIRTHVEPPGWTPSKPTLQLPWPQVVMVVHTIPEAVPGEPLRFGVWSLVDIGSWLTLDHGLVVGDGLSPDDREALLRDARQLGIGHVEDQAAFGETIHRICYQRRAGLAAWDVGETMGRLCVDWGRAVKGRFRGGLFLVLSSVDREPGDHQRQLRDGRVENPFHPHLLIRSFGGHRYLTGYSTPANLDTRDKRGFRSIISVRTDCEALTGGDLESVAQALTAWDLKAASHESLPEVKLAWADLRKLTKILRVAVEDHRRLLPGIPPSSSTSAGTYAGGLLAQIALTPPMVQHPNLSRGVLAGFMGAFYAGDVFCQARCRDLRIVKLDMGGAYTVAYHFNDSWSFQTAERVLVCRRDPDLTMRYVVRLVKRIERWWQGKNKHPLTPKDWKRLSRTLVWVTPNNDFLPHRPRSGNPREGAHMIVGPVTGSRPQPWLLADVLRSALETQARVPTITKAIRLVPQGRQSMKEYVLPTGRTIDPNFEDPVLAFSTERIRIASDLSLSDNQQSRLRGLLKGMAVSLCTGLPAQVLDDEPTAKPRPYLQWDPLDPDAEPVEETSRVIEQPGVWYWPPIAAGVTATARLLLALMRGAFQHAGGIVAYWDTDSLFVVATPTEGEVFPFAGGTETTEDGRPGVKALSYRQVHDLRWKIEVLSPYPPELRPHTYRWVDNIPYRVDLPGLLKREPENEPPPDHWGVPV